MNESQEALMRRRERWGEDLSAARIQVDPDTLEMTTDSDDPQAQAAVAELNRSEIDNDELREAQRIRRTAGLDGQLSDEDMLTLWHAFREAYGDVRYAWAGERRLVLSRDSQDEDERFNRIYNAPE